VKRRRAAACAGALLALVSCGPSAGEEATDLCGDLRSFGATFDLLIERQPGVTVGEVRGALEKVTPFLDRVVALDASAEALDVEIAAVEEAFREDLQGFGDDEPASRADDALGPDRPRLASALSAAAAAIGCSSNDA
jgi:hypothetical protein